MEVSAFAVFVTDDFSIIVGDTIDPAPFLEKSHTRYRYDFYVKEEYRSRMMVLKEIMHSLRVRVNPSWIIIVVDLKTNTVVRRVYWTYHEED